MLKDIIIHYNEFSKPSSIKKALEKGLYRDGDPLADQISYCYAHYIKSYQASTVPCRVWFLSLCCIPSDKVNSHLWHFEHEFEDEMGYFCLSMKYNI
jgi:hypothetical protein